MNVVVLQGVVTRPAERRTLASGAEVLTFELAASDATGHVSAVPVRWPVLARGATGSPCAEPVPPADGTEVVVTGSVQRRFFRVGSRTESRTEVVADAVVPVRARRRARTAVDRALGALVP